MIKAQSSGMTLGEFQCELRTIPSHQRCVCLRTEGNSPICGTNWKLLVDKLASFLENEVTPLGFATLACAKRTDQNPFRVRDERIREFFL